MSVMSDAHIMSFDPDATACTCTDRETCAPCFDELERKHDELMQSMYEVHVTNDGLFTPSFHESVDDIIAECKAENAWLIDAESGRMEDDVAPGSW